ARLAEIAVRFCILETISFQIGGSMMATSKAREDVKKKVDEIRNRLAGDIKSEELQKMRVQIDLLEQAISDAYDFHHHDTELPPDHGGAGELMDRPQRTRK